MSKVEQITKRKLIMVKQIFNEALFHSERKSNSASRILAMIGFDLAVETILKTVYSAFEDKNKPKENFPALVDQTERILKQESIGSIPKRKEIFNVHEIRNDAQHKARYPTSNEIDEVRIYIRDFLNELISQVWNISFFELSFVDFIKNDEIRSLLTDSEQEFRNTKYVECVKKSAYALEQTLRKIKEDIVGESLDFTQGFVMLDSNDEPSSMFTNQTALNAFRTMQNSLLFSSLGLNYLDYRNFKKIAGEVHLVVSGKILHIGLKEDLTQEDAHFVLMYSIDTINKIEDLVGDIENPFKLENS